LVECIWFCSRYTLLGFGDCVFRRTYNFGAVQLSTQRLNSRRVGYYERLYIGALWWNRADSQLSLVDRLLLDERPGAGRA
jgi:hypothetical protein